MSKKTSSGSHAGLLQRLRRRFQLLAFALLYRFGGPIYDHLTVFLFGNAWDRWRRMVLPHLDDGPVLDLGCGTGALVETLTKLGIQAFGLDREPSMLTRARLRKLVIGRLIRADARYLPLSDGKFSNCVATFPSPFILQAATLDEIARVLRPGGRLVVVLTGRIQDHVWWRAPIRLMLRVFYGGSDDARLPDDDLLSHPLFEGKWLWAESASDRALLWLATRR